MGVEEDDAGGPHRDVERPEVRDELKAIGADQVGIREQVGDGRDRHGVRDRGLDVVGQRSQRTPEQLLRVLERRPGWSAQQSVNVLGLLQQVGRRTGGAGSPRWSSRSTSRA